PKIRAPEIFDTVARIVGHVAPLRAWCNAWRAWRTWGVCRVGPLLARHAGETRHGGAPPGVSGGGMRPALLSTCADDPQHLPARVEPGWQGGHRVRLPRRQGWSPRLVSPLGGMRPERRR